MTSRKYKKSPIAEAICEFQFEDEHHSSWDLATPGLVYEEIRSIFPIRRQAARFTLGIAATSEEINPHFGTVPLMQFLREDEKALIQVGPNILSINILKPYPSWQGFLPLIEQGFHAYQNVVEFQNIQRIGLRYINHINILGQSIKLEDYFEFRPYVGSNLPQDYGTFGLGIQIPFESSRDILNLQLTSLSGSSNQSEQATILLSLDYFLLKPKGITLNNVFTWIDTAHNHIEDAFEASITQNLRDLFEEVKG